MMDTDELNEEFAGARFRFDGRGGPAWCFVRWTYPATDSTMFIARIRTPYIRDMQQPFYDWDLAKCTPLNMAARRLLAFARQVGLLTRAL